MSRTKKQTLFGIIMSLIMLMSMASFATVSYAKNYSDASSFTITSKYDKTKTQKSPFDINCTYTFKFGNAIHADSLTSTVSDAKATHTSVVSKWTSKSNVVKTKNGTGTKSASATCYGIVGSSTKTTYHEFKANDGKNSYTFIATGNR